MYVVLYPSEPFLAMFLVKLLKIGIFVFPIQFATAQQRQIKARRTW